MLWAIWLSEVIRSADPGKEKLLISFIRGRIIYGRWVGRRIRLPHEPSSSTRCRTRRSVVRVHPAVSLILLPKPHQEVQEKAPLNLKMNLQPRP